jgi:hypothetical protein
MLPPLTQNYSAATLLQYCSLIPSYSHIRQWMRNPKFYWQREYLLGQVGLLVPLAQGLAMTAALVAGIMIC